MECSPSYDGAACVITTSTRYSDNGDDPFRRRLFLRMVADLAAADQRSPGAFPLVVSDSSPAHGEVVDDVRAINPNVVVLDGRLNSGIAPQALQSIEFAYHGGAVSVLRMDPEKYGLVTPAILASLRRFMGQTEDNIMCIGRSPREGFASLPPHQQDAERIISRSLATLGLPEDSASGIRLMNRAGMEQFLSFDYAKHGSQWEYLWFVLLDAVASGSRVGELFLPFKHPVEMLWMETGLYEATVEGARQKERFYDEKRDNQAALIIPKVVAYAATLGISPTWDSNRQWVI